MKKQLQGISLILFGFMLMMFSVTDNWAIVALRWIPYDLVPFITFWAGLVFGVVGLLFSFKKES